MRCQDNLKRKKGQVLTEYVVIADVLVFFLSGMWGVPVNDEGQTLLDKLLEAFSKLSYYVSTVISIP